MPDLRVCLLGSSHATPVLEILHGVSGVQVVGLFYEDESDPAVGLARAKGVFCTQDIDELVRAPIGVDLLVQTGNLPPPEGCSVPVLSGDSPEAVSRVLMHLRGDVSTLETRLLRAVLDCLQVGIQIARRDGVVIYLNRALCSMIGIKPQDRLGMNVFRNPPSLLARALETGQPVSRERFKPHDSDRTLVVSASPVVVDGEVVGAVSLSEDMTDYLALADELRRSVDKIEGLRERLSGLTSPRFRFDDLVGISSNFLRAVDLARKAAKTDATVLLIGETGTGKEMFAHAIHASSSRASEPFITVNCAAVPEDLLESEFFGYEKGAFTGAARRRIGMFELANRGTIFLDEIGDMSLRLQAKLLRVLEERAVRRLGGSELVSVDVRVIAATNRDLQSAVQRGGFRADLFHRLSVVTIRVPPLRERKEDIPLLAAHLLRKLVRKVGKSVGGLSREAVDLLERYWWPGNVRELENVLERALITCDGPRIEAGDLDIEELDGSGADRPAFSLREMEKVLIAKALDTFGRSYQGKKRAAQALGISLATLYNKLKAHSLDTEDKQLRHVDLSGTSSC